MFKRKRKEADQADPLDHEDFPDYENLDGKTILVFNSEGEIVYHSDMQPAHIKLVNVTIIDDVITFHYTAKVGMWSMMFGGTELFGSSAKEDVHPVKWTGMTRS